MQVARFSDADHERMGPVFQEEIHCWRDSLHWDYGPSAELIKQFVSNQTLPGYSLRNEFGDVVGYTYYVVNSPVGFIGGLFVMRRQASLPAYNLLFQNAFQALLANPGVERIECQLFPFNEDVTPLFEEAGFEARRRYFLSLSLADEADRSGDLRDLPVTIQEWKPEFFEEATAVIRNSYRNSPDFELCLDYQSVEGCARFLRNLIENPGCGAFDPGESTLAFDENGNLCGLLIVTRISDQVAMIPQISIRRDWQGRGIGTALLRKFFHSAKESGLSRVTLSVSADNEGAYRLYRRLGFGESQVFHAYIWRRIKSN